MKLNTKVITRGLPVAFLLALLPLVAPGQAFGQTGKLDISHLDRFADQAAEIVDVNIDRRLLSIVSKILNEKRSREEKVAKELVADLEGVYVKRFAFDTEGQFTQADIESIRQQLNAPGWSKVVNVRSRRKGNYDVSIMTENDVIKGLAVLAVEPKAVTVVNIVGPIDLEKLSQLEGHFGIPRLELEGTDKPADSEKAEEAKADKKPSSN